MKSNETLLTWPPEGLERLGHCPLCGATDRAVLYEGLEDRLFHVAPGRWTLYRCSACRLGYLDPRPDARTITQAYGRYFTHEERLDDDPLEPGNGVIARLKQLCLLHYLRWRYAPPGIRGLNVLAPVVWVMPRLRLAFDTSMRHMVCVRPGQTLLDVGCGNGRFMAWARAVGWHCTGIEIDPVAAERARARGLEVVDKAGALAGRRFDAVTISHVIEHVHDPRELLRSAHQLLVPGGQFWIETPNLDGYGHTRFGRNWRDLDPPRHLQIFHPALLRDMLVECGFGNVQYAPWQRDWEAIAPASRKLAEQDFTSCDVGADPEDVGRSDPDRREFITFTATAVHA